MYASSGRKRREECQSIVKDKVTEAEWKYFDVNEHWQQMKNITMVHRSHVDCQKVHAGIRKDGGGMRKLLKQ